MGLESRISLNTMDSQIYEDNRFQDDNGFHEGPSLNGQTSAYPDPEDTPTYPWLGGRDILPPDPFLSIARGNRAPIVHEGFIPDGERESEIDRLLLQERASSAPDEEQDDVPGLRESDEYGDDSAFESGDDPEDEP